MIIAGFGERVIFPVVALTLDTGPLYASLDRSDADHRACRHLIETATETLVIPASVLVELDYWIHRRLHPGVLVALLNDIEEGAYLVEEVLSQDYRICYGRSNCSNCPCAYLKKARPG